MKGPEFHIIREFIKIPEVFYSTETGKPFSYCISCEKYLLAEGVHYVIEKAVKQYQQFDTTDTIFEYAMCLECYDAIQESFSETSKNNIENYFRTNVDLLERRNQLLEDGELRIDRWISNCVVKGTSMRELTEFQIVCQCAGSDLLFTYLPFMIGNEAMDEVVQLLSTQTLGEIDGLYDNFFGLSPDLKSLLTDPRLLVV